jgi:hypothetical protein
MIGGRNRWSPRPRNGLKSHRKEGRMERKKDGRKGLKRREEGSIFQ